MKALGVPRAKCKKTTEILRGAPRNNVESQESDEVPLQNARNPLEP